MAVRPALCPHSLAINVEMHYNALPAGQSIEYFPLRVMVKRNRSFHTFLALAPVDISL